MDIYVLIDKFNDNYNNEFDGDIITFVILL